MPGEKLKVNQRVEILSEDPFHAGKYPSRVEEIRGDRIVLAAPLKRGVVVPLRKGETVMVNYFGKLSGYSFTTRVVDTSYRRLPLIAVEWPVEISKLQRRNFIRVPASLPVRFLVLDDSKQPVSVESYSTETLDLSGGGVMISSPVKLAQDSCLNLFLTLPGQGELRVLGRVARVQESRSEYGTRYLLGIDFLVIDESDRDRIIKYVFELQREMRRKGLI